MPHVIPLKKSWRWFGQDDPVTFQYLRQMEIENIVTSMYHVDAGQIWTDEEIKLFKNLLNKNGFQWTTVESLPVSDGIKLHDKHYDHHVNNYIQSLENLGQHGIDTVCYNFMTGIDWIRTDLVYRLPSGGEVMHFDLYKFIAFDVFILKRPGAENDYSPASLSEAEKSYSSMSPGEREKLANDIIVKTQGFIHGRKYKHDEDYRAIFLENLHKYTALDNIKLRENFGVFMDDIMDTLEKYNIRMCIHPDDPPFPVLGMPRIVSTADDLSWLFKRHESLHNGLTFCSGSFSASINNNPTEILNHYKERVHFAHLRNTEMDERGNFHESGHIAGKVNLTEMIYILLNEQVRRKNAGRKDFQIPVRPDHGIKMLDDFNRDSPPGYPMIGRYRGLLEITGIEKGLSYLLSRLV